MHWLELTNNLTVTLRAGSGDPVITDIAYDSRTVKPGALFVAIGGMRQDGASFITDAIARGAVAIVGTNPPANVTVPYAQVENPRVALGQLSAALWQCTGAQQHTIGVTGTNGKTTIATMLHGLMSQRYGAEESWLYGTISYATGTVVADAARTTPESRDILQAIATAQTPPQSVVMEVSSHALELSRVAGLLYDSAIWTNLTQDHLDFHLTMERYYEAKKLLFTRYLKSHGTAVINIDDPYGARLAGELDGVKVVTYGESHSAQVRISGWTSSWTGSLLELDYKGESIALSTRLSGGFNRYNLAAVAAAALCAGIDTSALTQGIRQLGAVPGRMERVELDAPFSVVVDYAHTPDALEKVLATARTLTRGKLICVFGCGGDRDKSKRRLMGEVVVRMADEAYVTSDNPRSESPQAIIDDILTGVPLDYPHMAVADRSAAIRRALAQAGAGDCLVIAGKGHETYQEIKGVRTPFDDREVACRHYAALVREQGTHA